MKSIYFLIPLVFLLGDVFSQGYRINGKIYNCDNKWVFLVNRDNRNLKLDSVKCLNNQVNFSGKLDEPIFVEMKVEGDKSFSMFFIENEDFSFTTYQDSLWKIKLIGSPLNDLHYEYEAKIAHPVRLQLIENTMTQERLVLPKDSIQFKAINSKKDSLQALSLFLTTDFIIKNKSSFLSLYYLTYQYTSIGLVKSTEIIESMDENVKNTPTAQRLQAVIRKIAILKVNDYVPNFKLKDINGKSVSLSDFKNKNVLINFWASWCGPCRKEHSDLIRLSGRYQSKNVVFISISTDKNIRNWIEAVKKDKLSWIQLLDEENNKGLSTSNDYGVSGIPQTILIDGNGKMLIVSDKLGDIEEFLAKFL